MKNKIKFKFGISLIVLVITIVVIIILAAAVILSLGDNNPIESANKAKLVNTVSSFKDELNLSISSKLSKDLTISIDDIDATGEDILTYIPSMKNQKIGEVLYINLYEIKSGKLVLKSAQLFELSEAQAKELIEIEGGNNISNVITQIIDNKTYTAPIPSGFTASNIIGENSIEKGLVIYEGTGEVTSDDLNSNGIIDVQENRNQFVWIPVNYVIDKTNVSALPKNKTILNNFLDMRTGFAFGETITESTVINLSNRLSEPSELAQNWEINEYNAMVASVNKYGGFYVARYEAGDGQAIEERNSITEAHEVVSKKNSYTYKYVPWNSTTGSIQAEGDENGAVKLSHGMYSSSTSVTSHLIYGVEWDAIMYYATIDGKNVSYSVSWGNQKNYSTITGDTDTPSGSIQKTGSSDIWKTNNIYDLSGNLYEWTMEMYKDSEYKRACRGDYASGNANCSAGHILAVVSKAYFHVGFRVSLYIK